MASLSSEFFVSCLCAQWCGTCREYKTAFTALQSQRPGVAFVWVDVEDEPELAGEVEVDNFPTLVIQRGSLVLFCGPMIPEVRALSRLLDSLMAQTLEESAAYAQANAERSAWQGVADIYGRYVKLRASAD